MKHESAGLFGTGVNKLLETELVLHPENRSVVTCEPTDNGVCVCVCIQAALQLDTNKIWSCSLF